MEISGIYNPGDGTNMKINGAWYLGSNPGMFVIELINGELKEFEMKPYRVIKESDLSAFKGPHPRKSKGQPMPEYLYNDYGLMKNPEAMSEVLRIRLRPSEMRALENIAKINKETVEEFTRDLIYKSLEA